jgi:hypothetical protein
VSVPPDDYRVGYGRPPQHSRWKKGQSGNPRGRPKKVQAGTVGLLKALLMKQVRITENGESRPATVWEAILARLSARERAGDARAPGVLQRWLAYAASQQRSPGFTVINDYTEYNETHGTNFPNRVEHFEAS